MKDIKKIFQNVEKQLKQSNWFENNWQIYNRGAYLHLYKTNWYNHNLGGVHFETYIETPQIKRKEFPICMHAEEDCPSQQHFIKNFLELENDRLKSWKGYRVIAKGYHILEKTMPLNFKNLEQKIFNELNRLRQLEFNIDSALNSL